MPSCSYAALGVGTQTVSKGRPGQHAANTVQASLHIICGRRVNVAFDVPASSYSGLFILRLATPCQCPSTWEADPVPVTFL